MKKKIIKGIISFIIVALVLLGGYKLYEFVSTDLQNSRIASITDSIQQAAIQCYATEGIYPSSLAYLENNYGLLIDHNHYIVDYQCYSSNEMPAINVLVK